MKFKSTVAAFIATVMISLPVGAVAQERLERLMSQLQSAEDNTAATRLENQIISEWSKAGSPAMELLLKRGRDALEVSDTEAALDHFQALTDHAPEFAEGWHGLALAYFEADRLGPSLDALEHVLALNPNHFGALRGVGAIYEQLGQEALAYEAYERVLTLRPHDPDVIGALERLDANVKGVTL